MKPETVATRTKVLDALLAGREISCTQFAREIGGSENAVSRMVQEVRDALHARPMRSGMTLRIFYRVRDEQRLRRARQAMANGGSDAPVFDFAPLLRTWQIARRDIAAPRRVYCIPMDGGGLLGRRSA